MQKMYIVSYVTNLTTTIATKVNGLVKTVTEVSSLIKEARAKAKNLGVTFVKSSI